MGAHYFRSEGAWKALSTPVPVPVARSPTDWHMSYRLGIGLAAFGLVATAGSYTVSAHLENPAPGAERVAVNAGPRIAAPRVAFRSSPLRPLVAATPPATALRATPKVTPVSPPSTRAPVTIRPASTTVPAPTTAPAPTTVAASNSPPDSCAASIAAVEARGLYPAPGFVVICPGSARGHEGMTCMNEPGICPAMSEIVISLAEPFVVANEFENSRIFSGASVRCDTIDCGGAAYGY